MIGRYVGRDSAGRATGRRGAAGFGKRRKLPFCPKLASDTPQDRLKELERYARTRCRTFGSSLAFDDYSWRITKFVPQRYGVPSRKGEMHLFFFQLRDSRTGPDEPMTPAIAGFARAYLRLCRGIGYDALRQRMVALRYVETAMRAGEVTSVCDLTRETLDAAVLIAKRRYAASAANAYGYQIESIARYLAANRLAAPTLLSWRHRLPAVKRQLDRSSEEFILASEKKMPSAPALSAIPLAYLQATHPCDVIVICLATIAGAAPGRVNEALALGEDCEVTRTRRDGTVLTGVRYPGSKRYGDHVKLSASSMAPVVRDALTRLRDATADGRRIKRWYDDHRHVAKLYLPPELEHLRDKARLTSAELGALLGMRVSGDMDGYVRNKGLADLPKNALKCRSSKCVSFSSVQSHLLSFLPKLMARAGGEECHPLLVVQWGTFRRRVGCAPSPCMFQMVEYPHVYRGLRPTRGRNSLFQRLGLDSDGSVVLHHHQMRHWLNTLLQQGGASQSDIRVWSGRADERHNGTYDHSTDDETRLILQETKRYRSRLPPPATE